MVEAAGNEAKVYSLPSNTQYALPLFSVMMLLDLMHAAESESALETQDYRN